VACLIDQTFLLHRCFHCRTNFLIMKITIFLLFTSCFFISLTTQAQERDTVITAAVQGYVYKPKLAAAAQRGTDQLQLPSDFTIQKFADGLGQPRMMAITDDGTLYVTRRKGDVVMLKDTDGDGEADVNRTVLELDQVHGITLGEDGKMYLATVNQVFSSEINEDGALSAPSLLLDTLPDGGQHANRTIELGPDGKLYISVGSTCNACEETDPESATLLVANADGSDRKIFAKGLRNTIGFDWHLETGILYGLDHGIDWLGDTTQKEELNRLEEGNHYGWPYVYEDGRPNPADQPPQGMSYQAYAEQTTFPELTLPAHCAPLDMIFYKGTQFPEAYRNSALVTLHGSWNRSEPVGYKVVKINFDQSGQPTGYEDFITGFLSNDQEEYTARVCGLAMDQRGNVFISDDAGGAIYKLSYDQPQVQTK